MIVYDRNVSCPINFTFGVSLSTNNGSAGNEHYFIHYYSIMTNLLFTFSAVSPTDYSAVDTTLIFAACQMRSCVNIFIVDDIILENDESFNVTLERIPDLDSTIILDPVNGEVQITNDDGRYHDDGRYRDDDYMVVHNNYCRGDYAKSIKHCISTNTQT